MSGRLAEIESRHDVSRPALLAGAKRASSTYAWVTDEVVTAIEQDIPWLIARVRELEARAARWYPVLMAWRAQNDTWAEYEMLAAKEDVDDERMYVMRRAWTIGDRVLEELGKACRAALAALEAE
jgi:hypothetical protein